MLKPNEREALAFWRHDSGRHMMAGALSVLIPSLVVMGLLIGLTVN